MVPFEEDEEEEEEEEEEDVCDVDDEDEVYLRMRAAVSLWIRSSEESADRTG